MTGDTERHIQDLIRTSVLEVVRTDDDLERLLESGLLKSLDDVAEVTEHARKILRHACDECCKRRVKADGKETDCWGRKMHSVRDTPDPTRHCYIPVPHGFQKATIEVLKETGMFIRDVEFEDRDVAMVS